MPSRGCSSTTACEQVEVKDLNPLYSDPLVLAGNPFLADSLLIGEGGKRTISKIGPSFVYNTVDHPIFPTTGTRYTLSMDFGGHRRQHELRESAGGRHLVHPARRQAPDVARASARRRSTSSPTAAPSRCRSSRSCSSAASTACAASTSARSGRAIRSTGLVLGGNKSLLFNAEYLITIAGPGAAGAVLRRGSGARPRRESFAWKEPVTQHHVSGRAASRLRATSIRFRSTRSCRRSDREISADRRDERVQDVDRRRNPVLHAGAERAVPADFRANPSRGGVLDNNLQPEKKWKFRFAVGSTF